MVPMFVTLDVPQFKKSALELDKLANIYPMLITLDVFQLKISVPKLDED